MTFTTTITRDDQDIEVEIEFTYHPASRGARDSLGGVRGAGPPLEPDDPEECEITSVRGESGEIDLDSFYETEFDDLIQKCFDHLDSQRDAYNEADFEERQRERYDRQDLSEPPDCL